MEGTHEKQWMHTRSLCELFFSKLDCQAHTVYVLGHDLFGNILIGALWAIENGIHNWEHHLQFENLILDLQPRDHLKDCFLWQWAESFCLDPKVQKTYALWQKESPNFMELTWYALCYDMMRASKIWDIQLRHIHNCWRPMLVISGSHESLSVAVECHQLHEPSAKPKSIWICKMRNTFEMGRQSLQVQSIRVKRQHLVLRMAWGGCQMVPTMAHAHPVNDRPLARGLRSLFWRQSAKGSRHWAASAAPSSFTL